MGWNQFWGKIVLFFSLRSKQYMEDLFKSFFTEGLGNLFLQLCFITFSSWQHSIRQSFSQLACKQKMHSYWIFSGCKGNWIIVSFHLYVMKFLSIIYRASSASARESRHVLKWCSFPAAAVERQLSLPKALQHLLNPHFCSHRVLQVRLRIRVETPGRKWAAGSSNAGVKWQQANRIEKPL